ncbi:hypothetical protein P9G84_19040 [Brevibacillus centrosporus]|uniref:hypothetical protein n=1 Tax=Brevibacillus centrosporus TaxID=54910 RepID=UPI000F0A637A|nr:hypothetical protein [Brevibacillus centrosporus]MEC2131023.1 hypothetical protein [Brevibacillus centrosporus]RNB72884.1 hypothetical protein EDM55_03310 [Brevibacillus centrosporus]GED32368.1 hypothetical protein BCE02nite_35090 [Brevibacillus centrosporus]
MLEVLSKEKVQLLKSEGLIHFISLWDTVEKAKKYYHSLPQQYYAYKQDYSELTHAFSTPIKVYKLIGHRNSL